MEICWLDSISDPLSPHERRYWVAAFHSKHAKLGVKRRKGTYSLWLRLAHIERPDVKLTEIRDRAHLVELLKALGIEGETK